MNTQEKQKGKERRKISFAEKTGMMKRPEIFDLLKLLNNGKEPEDKQIALFLQKFRWIAKWKFKNSKIREQEFERILYETLNETDDIYRFLNGGVQS